VSKSLKDWDLKPLHAKFAYNRAPSYATKHSPFECMCSVNPPAPSDLLPLPTESRAHHAVELRAKEMKKLHEQIRNRIKKTSLAYKARENKHTNKLEFSPGDLV